MGIIASVSRTGFIALIVLGLTAVFIIGSRYLKIEGKRLFAILSPLIIIAILMVFLVPPQYWSVLEESKDITLQALRGDTILFKRFIFWDMAYHMWKEHPITGVGIGQFSVLFPYYSLTDSYDTTGTTHNSFISLLTETGIIGLFLYLNWLWVIIRSYLTAIFRVPKPGLTTMSWFLALIVMVVFMMTNNLEYEKLLWITAGVSISLMNIVKTENNVEVGVG
jgi:O-antigen ligase